MDNNRHEKGPELDALNNPSNTDEILKAALPTFLGVLRTISPIEYVLFITIGFLNGASLWGVFYYIPIGHACYLAVRHVYDCSGSNQNMVVQIKQTLAPLSPKCLWAKYQKFEEFFYNREQIPEGKTAKDHFNSSLVGMSVRCFAVVQVYLVIIVALDALAPKVMSYYYSLFSSIIDTYLDISEKGHLLTKILIENGYGDRVDFINHVYVFSILVPILFVLITLFVFWRIVPNGLVESYQFHMKPENSVRAGSFFFIFLPIAVIFPWLLVDGAMPVSIGSEYLNIYESHVHESRIDALLLGLMMPALFFTVPLYAFIDLIVIFALGVRKVWKFFL